MAEKDPPVATTAIDRDEDGLTDDEERRIGTNPDKWDSDGDGITDGTEVNSLRSNPKLRDTDGDGLGDNIEMWTHTGIANPDTVLVTSAELTGAPASFTYMFSPWPAGLGGVN